MTMITEKATNLAMRVLLAGLLLVLAGTAGATAQVADHILIEGRAYALDTHPLESQLRDRRDLLPRNVSRSTANWRGYVAHWTIDGDRLLLRKVDVRLYGRQGEQSGSVDLLTRLFPGGAPVAATWYSGAPIIPDGCLVDYVHMGYGSTYAHYRVYRIAQARWSRHCRWMPDSSASGASASSRRSGKPGNTARPWPTCAGKAAE